MISNPSICPAALYHTEGAGKDEISTHSGAGGFRLTESGGAPADDTRGPGSLAPALASRAGMPHAFFMQSDPAPAPPVKMPFRRGSTTTLLNGIIALCALIEAILLGADWGLWGSPHWRSLFYGYGAFWAGLLSGWRPNYALQPVTMFFTYAFLHGGPGHLIGNMLVLAPLGRMATERLGARGFGGLYLAAMLGGGAGFGLLATSPAPMVGASGAIFGLAGAWVIWGWKDRRGAGLGGWVAFAPALWAGLGLVMMNAVMWVLLSGQLAWETHLGGTLAGAAAALILPGKKNGQA